MTLLLSIHNAILLAVTLFMAAVTAMLAWLSVREKRIAVSKEKRPDMDEETEELENSRLKYQQIFDTSLIAMSFYNPDGRLIDLNQKMIELSDFDKQGEAYFRKARFFDLPGFHGDFDPESNEYFYVCQPMNHPDSNVEKYVEVKVRSIRDDKGKLQYYAFSSRDCTMERDLYRQQREHDKVIEDTLRQIHAYEEELHYLLVNSNMYVWSSNIDTQTIDFSTKLSITEFSISFNDYLAHLEKDSKTEDAELFLKEYEKHDHNLLITRHFQHTPVNKNPGWYLISGMPVHDKQGRFTGHFGVMRDITHLIDIQKKLKAETANAKDSSLKKSAFLANMTHEIRTPLNAIVGFSDLLQTIDDPGERHEFIRIIRNNCDMLLRIINDILEVSNIDQANLAITPEAIDFAQAFNDTSETLAGRVQPPVAFIVDNPYPSFHTTLDKGRMQQVITNFVTNAVKYTTEGHIKIGYSYRKDPETGTTNGIYLYCEDTGAGIPKDKQDSVFERFVKLNDFVQGTGLGLSICQSIAKRCNGQIGVNSEGTGQGSTFWMWVPCERIQNPD